MDSSLDIGSWNALQVACVVFTGLLLLLSTTPSYCQDDVEAGRKYIESGQYDRARDVFETYLRDHPDDPEALFYMGKIEIEGAKSLAFFRRVWNEYPEHALADDALYAVGQYHYAKGYYVTAGKMFRSLSRQFPASVLNNGALYWAASCQLVADHPDSALALFDALLQSGSDSEYMTWARLGSGDSHAALGALPEALDQYTEALRTAQREDMKCSILARLGDVYLKMGQSQEAEKYYSQIRELYPQSHEYSMLGGLNRDRSSSSGQEGSTYTVQIGAFAHKENAIRLHDSLSGKGFDVEIVSRPMDDGKLLHAVQVGSFSDREDAQVVADRLRLEENLQPRILLKTNQ